MSLKMIVKDQSGFTYTLEAILGIFLIMGTVIYVTANMPYTAQKTGEHSKVQLMNIGRDNLDLTLITPISETCPSCVNPHVHRQYLLVADKNFVMSGQNVNFTVYYANTNIMVNTPLTLQQTVLGTKDVISSQIINGTTVWTSPLSNGGEYGFMAYDANGQSNLVTITVGYYFLDSDVDGIVTNQLVTGVVNDSNGGVPNLTIRIWGYQGSTLKVVNSSATNTTVGGNFSFIWSESGTGTYYIQAINNTNNQISNKHRIVYSSSGNIGTIESLEDTIYESLSTKIILNASKPSDNLAPLSSAVINLIGYGCPGMNQSVVQLTLDPSDPTGRTVIFTAYVAGDYYIFWGNTGGKCSSTSNDNANAAKTNSIIIHVLPLLPATGETQDNCVNATELNTYMRRYMPAYVNYNLYLIGPAGNRFMGCPDFPNGEVINGYPTAEAVAVYKLAHIKYDPTDINNMVEFRTVLWYK